MRKLLLIWVNIWRILLSQDKENQKATLKSVFDSHEDQNKNFENSWPTWVNFKYWAMMYLIEELVKSAKSTKNKVAKDMIKLLQNRFECFEGQVSSNLSWWNPEYWKKSFWHCWIESVLLSFRRAIECCRFQLQKSNQRMQKCLH